MTKTTWLEIEPIDTLFFRGAEAMEAGESHEVNTMFPPMPATIIGAIRSAILKQRGIAPADYLSRPDNWQQQYPLLGTPQSPGLDLLGPLFMADSSLILAAPAAWYANFTDNPIESGKSYAVQMARRLADNSLGLCGSVPAPFWIEKPAGNDMQPLAGQWVTAASFTAMQNGGAKLVYRDNIDNLLPDEAVILPDRALFSREDRVGLALTRRHTAKDGHLYSSVHIRMRSGVGMVVGIHSVNDICLDEQGVLQLGGEQRMCRYRLLENIVLPGNGSSRCLYALSPINLGSLSPELSEKSRASNKLLRVGGWDMQKKFHKPMDAYLPAGTVIDGSSISKATPQFITI